MRLFFLFLLIPIFIFSQNKLIKKAHKKYLVEYRPGSYARDMGSFEWDSTKTTELKKDIEKYKTNNGNDIVVKFFDFMFKFDELKKKFDDKSNTHIFGSLEDFLDLVYGITDLHVGFIKEIESLPEGEFNNVFGNLIFKINFTKESKKFVKAFPDFYFKMVLFDEVKWDKRFRYLDYLEKRGGLDYINKYSILRDKFLSSLSKNYGYTFYISETYGPSVNPDYDFIERQVEKLSVYPNWENLENNENWGDEYFFLKKEFKETISKYLFLKNLWVEKFNRIKNEPLEKLEKFEDLDCYLITDYVINKLNKEKFEAFTVNELNEIRTYFDINMNCNLHESRRGSVSIKKFMLNIIDNVLQNKSNKGEGYCISDKHKERLVKEYYPKNGIKLTQGITKIILKSDFGCSFEWEVYDTTLVGKSRVSYFKTNVKNSNDNNIKVTLLGSDTF